jgi:hypothetical protein
MDFITGKALPRRTVLRGLGATVALPFLDAMSPAASLLARVAATPTNRFQAIFVPNGMAMEYWHPLTVGREFELTPILQPFAPFREQMLVFSGLDASWNYVHAGASGSFLTGTARGGTKESDVLAEKSIDQMIADEYGKSTQIASLELSLDKEGNAGQCTSGLSCAYTQTISWRTATQPLPMENNPRAVFERLVGDSGSTDPAVRLARMQQKKSILDSVMDQLGGLNRRLGPDDRVKVAEYTAAIRDVERRIELAESESDLDPTLLAEEPRGVPSTFEEHLQLMFDLQLLALQSDLTRVVTFMIGREQSTRTYPQVGVPDAHHPLSHHQNDPGRLALMSKINAYHAKLTADYLAKLAATPDGDGSLLDHMTIMYGTCMSNSTRHAGDNVPILLLGGGAGRFKGGRHLNYPSGTSHANLLVTIMDKFDLPVERIGESTDELPIDFDTLSEV